MPGFIESHGYPIVSGQATQAPARSISPWDAPTWNDVLAIFAEAIVATPADVPLLFNGFDALLHGTEHPTARSLDAIFGDRLVAVADNSGHGVYFTTALIASQGTARRGSATWRHRSGTSTPRQLAARRSTARWPASTP